MSAAVKMDLSQEPLEISRFLEETSESSLEGLQLSQVDMNPGTLGSVKVEKEPVDCTYDLGQSSVDQKMMDNFAFETIKIEPHYTEPGSHLLDAIVKEEADFKKETEQPTILPPTKGEQRTSVETDSSITGTVEVNEHNTPLEQYSLYQEISDHVKFEDNKIEPYYCEPSCPHLEPVIKDEVEVPKQCDKSRILLSTSEEKRASTKLEMEIKTDDLGIWEDEPVDSDGKKTGSAVPRKAADQQEKQNEIGKICETHADTPVHLIFYAKVEPCRLRECVVCGKAFAQKSNTMNNMMIHEGKKPYKCSVCRKVLASKSNIRRRKMINTGEKPLECDVCGKAFARKRSIRAHMVIHIGEKPHKCSFCCKAFTSKSDMRRHEMIHNGEKPHQCDVCGKVFSRRSTINYHKLIHSGEKPHKCNVCGKAFAHKGQMTNHIMIHEGKKPHKCSVCCKAFALKTAMRIHMSIHRREKPHECNYCGKTFVQKSHMKAHMLIHTREKPHKCNYCGKAFAQKSHIKKHILIHTGEKPHTCNVCGMGFSQKNNMARHMMIHDGKKPYECKVCSKAFASKGSMTRHGVIHIREKSQECNASRNTFI